MQPGHLLPQLGILPHHGTFRQILRLVSVDLLPDVVAGIDIGHHVVEDRELGSSVLFQQLVLFVQLGFDGGNT
jgi:hypothetical protein